MGLYPQLPQPSKALGLHLDSHGAELTSESCNGQATPDNPKQMNWRDSSTSFSQDTCPEIPDPQGPQGDVPSPS